MPRYGRHIDVENSCLISLLAVVGGAKEIFSCGKPFCCSTTFRWSNSLAMLSFVVDFVCTAYQGFTNGRFNCGVMKGSAVEVTTSVGRLVIDGVL